MLISPSDNVLPNFFLSGEGTESTEDNGWTIQLSHYELLP